MYSFFKKSIAESGILSHFTDYHSHILPGVDDGVKHREESVTILDHYERLGIQEVVFTPHIMEEYPRNKPPFLRDQFEGFKDYYKGNVKLRLAAEYMIDGRFTEHLKNEDLLPLKENFLLVETSYAFEPPGFLASIKEAKDLGYRVILAHPERYSYMSSTLFIQLKQLGVLFQLNIPSLLEYYGPKVSQNAKELLLNNEYYLCGSDIHRLHTVETIFKGRRLGKKEIEGIMRLVNSE